MTPTDLLTARRLLGLTQPELGRQIGVRPETISRQENGHELPSQTYTVALEALLRRRDLWEDFMWSRQGTAKEER
jgi:DNA-binding XRE family transcriptional regulator